MSEGEANMNGGEVFQMRWPVIAGMPTSAVIFVGRERVFKEWDGLPRVLTRRFNTGAM